MKGPKDAFVETMRTNTSLIRRHLRTPNLRLRQTVVGTRSLTAVTVVSIEGITNDLLVKRLNKRLESISIDALLSPSAVEEYVTGSRATAFPLMQYTQRTDTFCQGLLDGRVGLLVDGLPLGYLLPVDLGYLMESAEDRSRDYISASCIRILRYLALLGSLLLPGVYAAIAMHHMHLVPTGISEALYEKMTASPFTVGAEVLCLLVAFEMLQETGIHLPQAIGQSVSTVGGIVVGTAAVDAGLVSPMALVAVSIAGISGFVLPNRDLANAIRVWRFAIALLGAVWGLPGVMAGVIGLVLRLSFIRSLGVPYLRVGKNRLLRSRLEKNMYRNRVLKPKDARNQK